MKTWTIMWGWYGNPSMLEREEFTSRRACWERVKEIMAMRSEHVKAAIGHDWVSVLEVFTERADGKPGLEVVKFNVYMEGSKYCKWGNWGMSRSLTTGEVFG